MRKINGVIVGGVWTREVLLNPREVERRAESARRDLIHRAAVNHPNREYQADPGDLENLQEHLDELGYDQWGYPKGWTGPRTVDSTWTPQAFWEERGRKGRNATRKPTARRPERRGRTARSLTPDVIEQLVVGAWAELAVKHGDWVRLARIRPLLAEKAGGGLPRELVDAALIRLIKLTVKDADGFDLAAAHLAPDSNRKVLTDDDHDAAIRIGSEDKHLLALDDDYLIATGWRKKGRRWVR